MLDDGTGGNFAESFAVEFESRHDALQGSRQHLLITDVRVRPVSACKRDTSTADDGDTTNVRSDQHASFSLARRARLHAFVMTIAQCRVA